MSVNPSVHLFICPSVPAFCDLKCTNECQNYIDFLHFNVLMNVKTTLIFCISMKNIVFGEIFCLDYQPFVQSANFEKCISDRPTGRWTDRASYTSSIHDFNLVSSVPKKMSCLLRNNSNFILSQKTCFLGHPIYNRYPHGNRQLSM